MHKRIATLLLFVMVACMDVHVCAQENALDKIPRPLPPAAPPPPPQLTPPSTPPPSTPPETSATSKLPLIAGRPYKEALAILKRHEGELMNLPGVDAIDMDEEGILVYTDNPSVVPSTIEGLPVRTTIPLAQTFPPVKPEEPQVPPPQLDCGPYAHWEPEVGRCRRDALPPDSLMPSSPRIPLPPPAGVIVLRPGGVREEANACPEGFEEKTEREWRFCLPPGYADPLPPLWEPPIEGVPYEEALAILERHKPQLLRLPGVTGVGLSAYGIVVFTDNPAVVPSAVEGLPIVTRPSFHAIDG